MSKQITVRFWVKTDGDYVPMEQVSEEHGKAILQAMCRVIADG